MTCNAHWSEIQSQLLPGQTYTDISVVVIYIFKQKLSLLLKTLQNMFTNAGRTLYSIHIVEFQKCSLPYTHILIKFECDCDSSEFIDAVISAEMSKDADDAHIVSTFMLHHYPSANCPPSKYCQKKLADHTRIYRFNYLQPLQATTTIAHDRHVHY